MLENFETHSEPWLAPIPRKFVPADLKVNSWNDVESWAQKLQTQSVATPEELKKFLENWSEWLCVVREEGSIREIRMTCDTENEEIKKKYLEYVENFQPKVKKINFELSKKYYESPARAGLGADYKELDAIFANDMELFLEANLPIEEEVEKLSQNYQEITGSWMADWKGEKKTLPEMMVFLQSTDRAEREAAYKASAACRVKDVASLDELFEKLWRKRKQIANNLGFANYRDLVFKRNRRDYTPDDCKQFHASVESAIKPLIAKIHEKRRKSMGLDVLKPWDLACDPKGLAPLTPFKTVKELQDGVEEIFKRVDIRLSERFRSIRPYQDLDSRKGKAPGGYQANLEEHRIPFIFTNAAGVHHDVETLLHEGGHAIHTLQARAQKLYWYEGAPMEFCEVASMSQELLGGPHYGVFYKTKDEGRRAQLQHLESVLEVFPWIMTVDAFQQEIYENEMTPAQRHEAWLKQHVRFDAGVDWTGLEEIRKTLWHKQLHIFLYPFYYIEYAISQIGALQIYRNFKKNGKSALDAFLKAMSLGGSTNCRAIYKTAGIEFRFDTPFIEELAQMVMEEIMALE